MDLSQNIQAVRVKGTLEIALADGRTATLDVDLDTSDPETFWGVDHEHSRPWGLYDLRITRRLATTYSIRIPTSLRDDSEWFTLRIPVSE